jgi:hypothetical protein
MIYKKGIPYHEHIRYQTSQTTPGIRHQHKSTSSKHYLNLKMMSPISNLTSPSLIGSITTSLPPNTTQCPSHSHLPSPQMSMSAPRSPAVRPYSRFLVRFLLPTQSPLIPILTNATGSAANAATPTAHASVQTDAQSMAITNVLDAMSTRAHSLNHARDVEGDLASMLVFLMAFCERMRNVGRVVD